MAEEMDPRRFNVNVPSIPDYLLSADPRGQAPYGFPPMQPHGQGYGHPFAGSVCPPPPWLQIPPVLYNPFGPSFPTSFSPPFTPAEEEAIVSVLARGAVTSTDFCSALETLHGRNGRHQQQWKDHYLRNRSRFDKLIDASKDKYLKNSSASGFVPSIDDPTLSHSRSSSSMKSTRKRHILDYASDSDSQPGDFPRRDRTKQTSTEFSMSTRRGKQKTSSAAGSPSPQPPSTSPSTVPARHPTQSSERSTTRPSNRVPMGHGHAFTDEEKRFFRKTLVYEIGKNPNISRADIVRKLHAKAPHRTESSWDRHWYRSPHVEDLVGRLRNNQLATPEGDEHGHSSDDSVSRTDPDDRNDQQFTIPQTTKSQRWTRDEIVALANHVATLSDTNPSRIDWIRCQTVIPRRTVDAISSFYHKNRTKIEETIASLGLASPVAGPSGGPSTVVEEPSPDSVSHIQWPAAVHIYGYDSDVCE